MISAWRWWRYRCWYWLEGRARGRLRAFAYDRWCAAYDDWGRG